MGAPLGPSAACAVAELTRHVANLPRPSTTQPAWDGNGLTARCCMHTADAASGLAAYWVAAELRHVPRKGI